MALLFLFPVLGVSSADGVAKAYMGDVISLVLGSFILALAIEHYQIHRRLPLNITSLLCVDPVRPPLLLLGITGTTMFVSMWIHNTACAVMMMPVATGILQRLPRVTTPAATRCGSSPGRWCSAWCSVGDRRDGDADGHRREHHPGRDVVVLLPGAGSHHLQLMDDVRASHGADHLLGALGYTLPHVLLQEHRKGTLCLPGQKPSEKRNQLVRYVPFVGSKCPFFGRSCSLFTEHKGSIFT